MSFKTCGCGGLVVVVSGPQVLGAHTLIRKAQTRQRLAERGRGRESERGRERERERKRDRERKREKESEHWKY